MSQISVEEVQPCETSLFGIQGETSHGCQAALWPERFGGAKHLCDLIEVSYPVDPPIDWATFSVDTYYALMP